MSPQVGDERVSNIGFHVNHTQVETHKIQNVRFSDSQIGMLSSIKKRPDMLRSATDTGDTTLSDFFSRPVKIQEITWDVNTNINSAFSPWQLYFENARVQNRLNNYALLRADLHIKIVINGNGFYYGRALAAYQPFSDFDNFTFTLSEFDLVQFSQMPKILLNPTSSQGGEMTIPFHWYRNNCQIDSNEIYSMGAMWISSYSSLQHTNGNTDPITVSVFAWAENVELSALTSNNIANLSPQVGEEIDVANQRGVVSGPATTVSKWAGYLTKVPVIGPYATATSMAASTIARVAGMFGYCKPAITKAPEPYRAFPTSSLAVTNVPDVSRRMTVDHKQELTLDPNAFGVGDTDCMDIATIAKTESYFLTFPWTNGDAPESLLANIRVDPCLFREINFLGSTSAYMLPGMASAALPFRYWTGSLKFRFQFICSAFHKGRVKIVYDPRQIDSTEYNVNYMKIIDLAEETDVSITVGPSQTRQLMEHYRPGTDAFGSVFSQTAPLTFNNFRGNGVLGIYVVNELTTASAELAPIDVAVFVSACDDFEVFVPDSYFQRFTFFPSTTTEAVAATSRRLDSLIESKEEVDEKDVSTLKMAPQIGEEVTSSDVRMNNPDGTNTTEDGTPQSTVVEHLAVSYENMGPLNLMHSGESIKSFRTMLKRFNKWFSIGTSSQVASWFYIQRAIYPFFRGEAPGAQQLTADFNAYNYCNTLMLHWVTQMFSGWRGSLRYKILPIGRTNNTHMLETFRVIPNEIGGVAEGPPFVYLDGYVEDLSSVSERAEVSMYDPTIILRGSTGHTASVYANVHSNPTSEYEFPFYSSDRFVPGKRANWTTDTSFLYDRIVDQIGWLRPSNQSLLQYWVATGEDFQTYFYTGMPRVYFDADPPPAAGA